MAQFAEPVKRYISGSIAGLQAAADSPRPPGFTFARSNPPEARRYQLLVLEDANRATVEARRKAGLPDLTLEQWERG